MRAGRALACLAAVLLAVRAVSGAEFRTLRVIPTPQAGSDAGAVAPADRMPVERALVEAAVRRVVESWNTGQLEALLAETLVDRERIVTAITEAAPRDARLHLLAVQGTQTLDQRLEPVPGAPGAVRAVSRVSATVRTQVEFNDPQAGFRRLDGTVELILRITHPGRR